MALESDKLVLSSVVMNGPTVQFDLDNFYLQSGDSPDQKSTDQSGQNYCARLMICNAESHMKLFFVTYEAMIAVIEAVVAAQGFSNRL